MNVYLFPISNSINSITHINSINTLRKFAASRARNYACVRRSAYSVLNLQSSGYILVKQSRLKPACFLVLLY